MQTTTLARLPPLALALLCTGVTGWLLLAEVVRGDVPLQSTHVLNGAALVLLIAAGHYTLRLWHQRRRLLSGLSCLGGIGCAVLVLAIGIARTSEGHASRASSASDRADQRQDVRDARDELARIGTTRTPGEIAADMAPLAQEIGRHECHNWVPDRVRVACKRHGDLAKEHARAQRRDTLQVLVRQGAGAAVHTDGASAVAKMVSRWSGWSEPRVRHVVDDIMTVTPVLTVELFAAVFWVLALSPLRSGPVRPAHGPHGPERPSGPSGRSGASEGHGPERPSGAEPVAAAPRRRYTRDEARADLDGLLRSGQSVTTTMLMERWGGDRPLAKQTLSGWLAEFGMATQRRGRSWEIGPAGPSGHARH